MNELKFSNGDVVVLMPEGATCPVYSGNWCVDAHYRWNGKMWFKWSESRSGFVSCRSWELPNELLNAHMTLFDLVTFQIVLKPLQGEEEEDDSE